MNQMMQCLLSLPKAAVMVLARADGSVILRETQSGADPIALGELVGETLLQRGANQILEDVYGAAVAAPQQP